jgi:hypothetical protein
MPDVTGHLIVVRYTIVTARSVRIISTRRLRRVVVVFEPLRVSARSFLPLL